MTYDIYTSVNNKPFVKQMEKAFNKQGEFVKFLKNKYYIFIMNNMYVIDKEKRGYTITEWEFDTDSGFYITEEVFDTLDDVKEYLLRGQE